LTLAFNVYVNQFTNDVANPSFTQSDGLFHPAQPPRSMTTERSLLL